MGEALEETVEQGTGGELCKTEEVHHPQQTCTPNVMGMDQDGIGVRAGWSKVSDPEAGPVHGDKKSELKNEKGVRNTLLLEISITANGHLQGAPTVYKVYAHITLICP